jgi:hypothetical protein
MATKLKKLSPEELAQKLATPGPIGPIGPQGERGEKGDRGDTGDSGATGTIGPMGIQGVSGIRGRTGESGVQGVSGQAGPRGLSGTDGQTPTLIAEGSVLKVQNADGTTEDLLDVNKATEPARRSTAQIGGGAPRAPDNNQMVRIVNITEDYTATRKDQVIIADAASGAITVTLPKVEDAINREIMVKRINKGGNKVTIAPTPPDTIDRDTGVDITGQHDCITLCSNRPTDWWIL